MKRISMSWAVGLSAGVLVALTASPAVAYKQMTHQGRPLVWDDSALPVSWYLSSAGSEDIHDGSDLEEVIRGFQSWQDPECTTFAMREPQTLAPQNHRFGRDNQNQLYWEETNWTFGHYVLGVTQPMFEPRSGRLYEADIALNGQHYTWSTRGGGSRTDVYTIAAHEQGHFLGLDHSCGERRGDCTSNAQRQAIMFASYSGRPQPTLGTDDIAGVCALYPANFRSECQECGNGWRCESNLSCSEGPAGDRCRSACDNDSHCPGSRCVPRTDGHGGLCACPGDLRGPDALCESSVQCRADLTCVRFDEASVCRTACVIGSNTCPAGEVCRGVQGGTACIPSSNGGNGSGDGGSDGGDGTGGHGLNKAYEDGEPCGCVTGDGGIGTILGLMTLGALVRRRKTEAHGISPA